MYSEDLRQHPTHAFISELRRRFPVEREMDRVLTRKMERRAGPGYSPITLETLVKGTSALIENSIGKDFALANVRWLTGGASKIQMAFDLDWKGPDGGARRITPMVLRMEPPESVVETSRLREFEVIKALENMIPVPPCYWLDNEGEFLPHPALIYGFAQGVTKPTSKPSSQVTGIGLNYGPELRPILAKQFLEQVGLFHSVKPEFFKQLTSFDPATAGSKDCVIRQVNWWRRVWEEDRQEDEPLMEVTYQWLLRNAPAPDHISVVHGDCRAGNFLYTEHDSKISAWLDWELALAGDRHQDLAWAMTDSFSHTAEDGKTLLISSFLPRNEFLEQYEKLSGLSVNEKTLGYYRVLCSYLSIVICGATGYRVTRGGKTHQDVVVAWLAMITNSLYNQLRTALEEVY